MAIISAYVLVWVISLLVTAYVIIYAYLKYAYGYWSRRGLISAPTSSVYGSLRQSLTMIKTNGEEMEEWYTMFKSQGHRHFGGYFYHRPFYVPLHPQLIKRVLATDFDHFVDHGGYVNEELDPLTAHLFSLSGTRWKHLRQKLTPTFTSGKLKAMFETLIDSANALTHCLDALIANDRPINIKAVFERYTTDVIGSCAFGLDCASFEDSDSEFIRMGKLALNPDVGDLLRMSLGVLFPSIARFFKIHVTNRRIDAFFRKLVQDTIEYREQNGITRNDFMQLLIQLKNKGTLDDESADDRKLTMNEVTAQAFLFFIGGFETSSTALTFALYELAESPVVQEAVREEVLRILEEHGGCLSYDTVQEMRHLNRAVLETLRKHPPVSVLQRVVTKQYYVPDSQLVLEKGVTVFVPALALHYDPDYYPNPDHFDPDRFTEQNIRSRPDYTYLPFGDGPRVCIAVRFAMMQIKVALCRLLCSYRFRVSSKMQRPIRMDPRKFVRSVQGGIWLNAEKIY